MVSVRVQTAGLKRDFQSTARGPRVVGSDQGPATTAGERVARLLLRDPDLNPCFSHGDVFALALTGGREHSPLQERSVTKTRSPDNSHGPRRTLPLSDAPSRRSYPRGA